MTHTPRETAIAPETAIHTQVIAAREGRDARVISRMASGWAVFGQQQFVRGYALLLPDPVMPTLNALGAEQRVQFLLDMTRLGDAILRSTDAIRINYAIFGNAEPALHAHVIPRYADEPEQLKTAQPWAYDWNSAPAFSVESLATLATAILKELVRFGVAKPMRYAPGTRAGEPPDLKRG
jgi:diadenosine tetraphosphate (Ap4A) HIT family hydrolase